MKILLVRGAFLNRFEGQNFEPLAKKYQLIGIASKTPIDKQFNFPVETFFSPYDLVRRSGRFAGRLLRGLFNRTLADSHFLFGLKNYVKKNGPFDIAHVAETYYGYDLQAINLKKEGFIKKVVSTCWETIAFNNETVAKKKRIKEKVRSGIDLFICPTERARQALIKEDVEQNKIKVIRLGVELKKFKSKNKKGKIDGTAKNFTILFVGRLVEEKGVMDLYNAFVKIKNSKLKAKDYNLKLKIIGEGPLKQSIDLRVRGDCLRSFVTIVTKLYGEMPQVYQDSDILVLPSKKTKTWEEQYGMVLVEAMASGLPIVAYKSGAIPEVLGDVGLLVGEGDIEGLKKAILSLVEDKRLKTKLGRRGRSRAEDKFNRLKIAKKLEKIYGSLV